MLDITFVKVEPYDVTIQMQGETRNIREVSPLADALIKSCLNEVNLNYYAQQNPRKNIPEEEIRALVSELRKDGPNPFPTDLILLVTYYLYNWILKQNDIREKALFFQADTRLQAFFAEVTRGLTSPYQPTAQMQQAFPDLTKVKNITTTCFPFYNQIMKTDLDILSHLGLIYNRIAVVEVPEGASKKYYSRVERRIARVGREYVENYLLKAVNSQVKVKLEHNMNALLDLEKPKILECLKVEVEGNPMQKKIIAERKKDFLICLGA